MMYRLLFRGLFGKGYSHCEHRTYKTDEDAKIAARYRLMSRPLADEVVIYRMAGKDTCGPMSFVDLIEK